MKVQNEFQNDFNQPYKDLFIRMSEQLSENNYLSYINLVENLENMSILSLSGEEYDNIREVKKIKRAYTRALKSAKHTNEEDSKWIHRDQDREISNLQHDLRLYYIEYPLQRVIHRICIHGLKRTTLKSQTPSVAVAYRYKDDITDTINDINFYLPDSVKIPKEAQKYMEERK